MKHDLIASREADNNAGERRRSDSPSLLTFGQPLTAEPLRRWPQHELKLQALRARLRCAEKRRNVAEEERVAASLARMLMASGTELDIAVRLGRRSVLLGNDELRVELAEWHSSLGQAELAVGMLAPLVETPGPEGAELLVRMALYWARLDQPDNALAALREAAAYRPEDPLIYELQGMVYGWAPQSASVQQTTEAYLSAATCWRSRGDDAAVLTDLLRAFDTDPCHSAACQFLATEFRKAGAIDRAFEVERRQAVALQRAERAEEARAAHRARVTRCLKAERFEEALSAAFEAGLDSIVDADVLASVVEQMLAEGALGVSMASQSPFDWLLARLGLTDLLAARLELAAEATEAKQRGRCFRALGALLEAAGGSSDRAFDAYLAAIVADPGAKGAFEPLRRHARRTGDVGPLLEALLGGVEEASEQDEPTRRMRFLELLRLAEGRIAAPRLALFCVESMAAQQSTPALAQAQVNLESTVAKADAELRQWVSRWQAASAQAGDDNERLVALRRVVTLLRLCPGRESDYEQALRELVATRPQEVRGQRWLERLLNRKGDRDALAALWTHQLQTAAISGRALPALLGLSRLERKLGNLHGALAVLAADDNRGLAPVAALQVSLAAQLGSKRLWAEGLLKTSVGLERKLRGWLSSVASTQLLQLGERSAALQAAEIGTRAAPELAAPLVAYAQAVEGREDRVAAVAYERAMTLTFPTSDGCRNLVSALTSLGDTHAAQVWLTRWLGVKPSATQAAVQLLGHAAESGDATRLGDVVAWAVRQAHPLESWATPLAEALMLLAEGDRARAQQLSRPLLNAFGPHPIQLRHALLHVAEVCQDRQLTIDILERQLATETGANRGELLWEISGIQQEGGNVEACLAALVRGLAVGTQPEKVLTRAEALAPPATPEAEFLALQLRASGLELQGEGGEPYWMALRDLGAAQWDLAQDPGQAVETWLQAADLMGMPSWVQFVVDWTEMQGLEKTIEGVYRLAESRDVPEQGAALLAAAAYVALRRGRRAQALQMAQLSLDSQPGSVDALALIESSAHFGEVGIVENAYRSALGATKGSYGERAVHYRAARYFEASDPERALRHAMSAFRAVPSTGGTFSLVLRLSQTPLRAEMGCRVLLEAADRTEGHQQAEWLRRAALVAVHCRDGAMRRADYLFQALLAEPALEVVELLGFALGEWARAESDGRALGLMRLRNALTAILPKLALADGARVAIAIANVALAGFSDSKLAFLALQGAVNLDAQVEDYGELLADAEVLALSNDSAECWLREYLRHTNNGSESGLELLALAATIAERVSSRDLFPLLVVRQSLRIPTDARLRESALQAVRECRQLKLPAYVHDLFPVVAKQSELFARAEHAVELDDSVMELSALSEALDVDTNFPASQLARLIHLAGEAGQIDMAERALLVAHGADFPLDWRSRTTSDLATRLLESRRPQRALRILLDACSRIPDDPGLLTQALSAARAAGEEDHRQNLLQRLIDGTNAVVKKSFWLNEAWEVAKRRSDPEVASRVLRQWLEVDPENTTALERLEAECEAREDWSELADLLGRHLELCGSAREHRRLVLRRSELLAGRLGLLLPARELLADLVAHAPADRVVVERLAEVSEQLGEKREAAEAWFSASGLASTRAQAAQLAERACSLFLDSGESLSARRVLAAPQAAPRTLILAQLAVRLERSCDNQPGLAVRLEELANVQRQATPERAAALLEAANLWRRLGDDERACESATKAAGWLPDDAEAQVLASLLEYRLERSQTPLEAERTASRLLRVEANIAPAQRDLAGFLLVEAVELREGEEAAMRELKRLGLGSTRGPLLSVAMAERLSRKGDIPSALEAFELALTGDLRGLRKASVVALAAARVAFENGLLGRAHRFLRRVQGEPTLEVEAARLRAELEASASDPISASSRSSVGKSASSSSTSTLRPDAPPLSGREIAPRSKPAFQPLTSFEEELCQSMESGQFDAGVELVDRLRQEPERVAEALDVLQRWWARCPGDRRALSRWVALTSGAHGRALSHVSESWGSSTQRREGIPVFHEQRDDAEEIRELLFSGEEATQASASALVWQGLRRTLEWPGSAELKPLSPVSRSSGQSAARVYFAAARRLGVEETSLLHRTKLIEPRISSAMSVDPVVVVSGEFPRNNARTRFELGLALAHSFPELCLAGCCDGEQLHEVLESVQTAFGPPKDSRTTRLSTTRLAGVLWETVSASGQRVLKTACEKKWMSELSLRALAYRVAMRTGLYVSGDLGVALHQVCRDEQLDEAKFAGEGGLESLCEASAMARDLTVMASSRRFAELRWSAVEKRRDVGKTRRGL